MKNQNENPEPEVINVEAEVVENAPESLAEFEAVTGDFNTAQAKEFNHPFPCTVKPEEVVAAVGEEDPGKFMQALANVGLEVGRVVSVMLKKEFIDKAKAEGKNYRKFERAKLIEVGGRTLALEYLNKTGVESFRYKDISEVEVLHPGQRMGTHELIFKDNLMHGVSKEKMLPYLKQLTSGDETVVRETREDGTKLFCVHCVYRDKHSGNLGMYTVHGDAEIEKLLPESFPKVPLTPEQEAKFLNMVKINNVDKLNVSFTDEMRNELRQNGKLEKPVVVLTNDDAGKEREVAYKVSIDKNLFIVRLQRDYGYKKNVSQRTSQNVVLSKKELVELTNYLKANGHPGAWSDLSSEKSMSHGILLNKASGANAHVVFQKENDVIVPKLNIYWSVGENEGVGKQAYTEKFKGVVELVEAKLRGEKPSESQKQVESKKEAVAEKQTEKKKVVKKASTGPKLKA